METKELKLKDVMCGDWVDVRNDASPNTPHIEKITPSHLLRDEHWYGIELTPEILEKNGFKVGGFTNLSPDYYHEDGVCSVCVNLKSTCDKSKSIWVKNKESRFSVTVEESRYSLEKKPLMLHQLQHAFRLAGIEKEIVI